MSEFISKDAIRAKARAAHAAGRSRDSHGFNWHAPALATWLEEFDRCANGHLACIRRPLANTFPQLQTAPAARRDFDQGQAA